MLGPTPRGFNSNVWSGAQSSAFLTNSKVILRLLIQGPPFLNYWPTTNKPVLLENLHKIPPVMGNESKNSIHNQYVLVQPVSFNRHLIWLWSQSVKFKPTLLAIPRNLYKWMTRGRYKKTILFMRHFIPHNNHNLKQKKSRTETWDIKRGNGGKHH